MFISVIIISINAVVPDKNLQVLEPKEIYPDFIEHLFTRLLRTSNLSRTAFQWSCFAGRGQSQDPPKETAHHDNGGK